MATFQKVKLGDIYSTPSRNGVSKPSRVRGNGYPMINMGEIFKYDRVNDSIVMEYVPLTDREKSDSFLQNGDLLFARQSLVVEGAGKCSIYLGNNRETTFESHLIRVRLERRMAEPLFYYYYFTSSPGKTKIRSIVNQVAAAGIRGSDLSNLEIDFPDLPTQTHIASILSTYDDLIENNEKRIKTLEEMAQLLYTEWFVKFKFPGHEKAKMVDSGTEYGMIAEGWEIKKLGEIIELAYGKALKGENRTEGNVLVYGSSGLVGTHNEKLVNGPGIVVGRKGNAGAVHWVDDDFYPIDTTYYVKSNLDLHFIYYLLKNHGFVMGDVAVPGLNRSQTYLSALLLPPAPLITTFSARVSHIFNLLSSLSKKNLKLGKMRDLLIPQLVTGKLELK